MGTPKGGTGKEDEMERQNLYDEMMADFEKYKKNREKVPLEVLKTKYKKPYEALKNKLAKELQWYVNEIAFLGIYDIGKDLKDDGLKKWGQEIARIYKEEEDAGLPKILGTAVFKHMDLREFENYVCYTLTHRIRYEVYAPYWLEHCKTEVGITTNDLIGMTWDPEHNLWEGKTEEGNPCWTVKLPPTQELIDKEKNEDRESFEKWMKELEAKEKKEETA